MHNIQEVKHFIQMKEMLIVEKEMDCNPFEEFKKHQVEEFDKFVENRISVFISDVETILKRNAYLKHYNQLSALSNYINDASSACEEALVKLSLI